MITHLCGRRPRMHLLIVASLLCAASPAQAQSNEELYEKAKQEKSLTLYGAGPSDPYQRRIKDFEEKYPGITVSFTGGLSIGLNKKIEEQLAAKKMDTDVAIFQTLQDFGRWKKQGALLPFRPLGSDKIDPAFKDEDGAFTTVHVNMITYAYNTELVPAAEVPRSALDFLKPRFAGKLIATDPGHDDAGFYVFYSIVEKYGWDYMAKYMAQKPKFVTTGHATVSNEIADGKMLATFDSTSTTPRLKAQGKPINLVLSQEDPTPLFLVAAAIFKDAPHPNAAKLFVNWYLDPAQQSRTGTFSPRSDVPPPRGWQPLSSYKLDTGYRKMLSDEARLIELKKRMATYTGPH
jgi:ABC-type Fe3+ transport system substrate-binding protein